MAITQTLRRHPFATSVGAILIVVGSYTLIKTFTATEKNIEYIVAPARRGTLTAWVGTTGQIGSSSQIDLKPNAAGTVTRIHVSEGQDIAKGNPLMQLDSSQALKAVRDAELNLESAKLTLEKLQRPSDALSVLQATNNLASARTTLTKLKLSQPVDLQNAATIAQKAKDALSTSYDDILSSIANAFLDLPNIMTNINTILYSFELSQNESSVGPGVWNVNALENTTDITERDTFHLSTTGAERDFATAKQQYEQAFGQYKSSSRYADRPTIETLLASTLETTKRAAQSLKSVSNMLDSWVNLRTKRNTAVFTSVKTYQTLTATFVNKVNAHLATLTSMRQTLDNQREQVRVTDETLQHLKQNQPLDLTTAEQLVREREASLAKLSAGADELDIRSQQLAVRTREEALRDAKERLEDYTLRSPLGGVVAKIAATVGDTIGTGSAVATLLTKQRTARVTLNEVDVARVAVGQRATLAVDAVGGLSITGSVASIDTIGAVTQGVVSYALLISFDTQDPRVKPGMSVTANIITDVRNDVVMVPNAAVRSLSRNDEQYVEVMRDGVPQRQPITVGISNDTVTEIVKGLVGDEQIVTKTIDPNRATTTATGQRPVGGLIPSFGSGFRQGGGR